ncbi:MAG: alpha/beta hydrolase [Candidatus Jordarchaeales archaeon]
MLFFEVHGEGSPLVMVEEWGCSRWLWFKQLRVFPSKYSCVVFDNRGVGLSDKPDERYSINLFSEDLRELLDFIGADRVFILGVSMGGFIAQSFALKYPERVAGLVLVSTCSVGRSVASKLKEVIGDVLNKRGEVSMEEALRKVLSFAFNPDYMEKHPEEVDQIVFWILEEATPKYALIRQLEAIREFNLKSEVFGIRAPTLIVTGTNDRIVPFESSEALADAIPQSRLVVFEGGSHFLFLEEARLFNRIVMDFLREVETGEFTAKPRKVLVVRDAGKEEEF